MRATFHWRKWWEAERVGVILALAVSAMMLALGVFIGVASGDWFYFFFFGFGMPIWFATYCAGWHFLVLGILKLRAALGLIAFETAPARPDQGTAERRASLEAAKRAR